MVHILTHLIAHSFSEHSEALSIDKEVGTQRGNELAYHPASLVVLRPEPQSDTQRTVLSANPRKEGKEWGIWEEAARGTGA